MYKERTASDSECVFCTRSKEWSENRGHHVSESNQESRLFRFSESENDSKVHWQVHTDTTLCVFTRVTRTSPLQVIDHESMNTSSMY